MSTHRNADKSNKSHLRVGSNTADSLITPTMYIANNTDWVTISTVSTTIWTEVLQAITVTVMMTVRLLKQGTLTTPLTVTLK